MSGSPAIVLATRPLGEADLLVVLLTPEHGKVRAAARGARRSKKRFAGGLAGGALGRASLVPRGARLWRLDAFVSLLDHAAVGRDLTRFAYVAYLCELTDVLVALPEPDAALFSALTLALQQTIDHAPDPAVLRWYELSLLSRLGLLPALEVCAVCGEPALSPTSLAADAVRFDARRGGVLCTLHGAGAGTGLPGEDGGRRSARAVAAAAALARCDEPPSWVDADDAPDPIVRRAPRDLLRGVLQLHLRRPLRALEFFAALPKPTAPRRET